MNFVFRISVFLALFVIISSANTNYNTYNHNYETLLSQKIRKLQQNNIDGEEDSKRFSHSCIHNEILKTIELQVPEKVKSPIEATQNHEQHLILTQATGNWSTIRILVDYTNARLTSKKLTYVQKTLMAPALAFLQSALKVYPAKSLSLSGKCSIFNIPTSLNTVTGYDLVVMIGVSTDSTRGWLASAGACTLDPITHRPILGQLTFNLYFLNQVNMTDPNDSSWRDWVPTIIHEITHILGFSTSLFPYYINPSTNQALGINNVVGTSNGRSYIITPQVVSKVQAHFGCTTLIGALLENDVGSATAGNHWERTAFGNEAMTGSALQNPVYSEITLALLESSGWYTVNYAVAGQLQWGKNEGCSIATAGCPTTAREFCTTGQGCSSDFLGIAQCMGKDPLSTTCSYWQSYSNLDCTRSSSSLAEIISYTGGYIGYSSRCFVTSLTQAAGYPDLMGGCFRNSCANNTITITIGSTTYKCTQTGQKLTVQFQTYKGTLTCPNITQFCGTLSNCPNNCSGVGTCVNSICTCWSGYKGTDCSQTA